MSTATRNRSEDMVLVPARKLRATRIRKTLVGVAALGAVGVLAANGTFASFSASTTNDDNVFSTGRLELSNTVEGGQACLSGYTGPGTGDAQDDLDANDNGECDALFALDLHNPGDTAEADLTIANTGDFNGLLKFWLPDGCDDAEVASPAGSLNLCDNLEVSVQETNTLGGTAKTACVYPAAASACADVVAKKTLADLAADAITSTPLPSAGVAIAKDAERFFTVAVHFPDNAFDGNGNGADNGYQNRSAAFDLVWRLQEAS
jgi:predicted ribosomally synthesized peptide with SipW-like signal peptide